MKKTLQPTKVALATRTTFLMAGLTSLITISVEASESEIKKEKVFEKIVVTAQRRVEDIQTVPVSVSALPEDLLADTDVRTLEDLTGAVPGLVATNSVSYSAAPISIRGIGGVNGGANFFNDEPVAVYVDGLYIGRLSFSTSDLLDVDSIQVLRGPQGTLFGRNATAGALILTTNAPTDDLEGQFKTGYSSLDEFRASGVISGGLIDDTLSGRLALSWSDKNGYGDNFAKDEKIGGSEDFTIRTRLTYTPTDKLTLNLIAEYMERKASPATIQRAQLLDKNGNLQTSNPFIERSDFEQLVDDDIFNVNSPNFLESETKTLTLAAHYDLGWGDLDTLIGYRGFDQKGSQDSDGTELTLFTNNASFENDQYSAELRVATDWEGPFSLIGGVFYIHEDNAMDPFAIQNHRGYFGQGLEPVFNTFQELDSVSLFFDGTYEINERLSLTAGIRYTYEEKSFDGQSSVTILRGGEIAVGPFAGTVVQAGDPLIGAASAINTFVDDADFTDVSPRFVLDYKLTDDTLLYASFSQGYKSGGYNSFSLSPAFEPEDINAYEIGAKNRWAQGRYSANISAFFYDYTNLQVRLGVPTGGVDVQNAAAAEIFGFELETTASPVDSLVLTANYAYLNAEFTEGVLPAIPTDQLFIIGAPVTLTDENIDGNSLSRAPEHQVYLAADYSWELEDLGYINLRADWRYQSSVAFLEVNQDQPTFNEDSFNELGLRVSFETLNEDLEIALYGQNITNERYVTQVTSLGSFPNAAVNEPAKWGIQFTYRYY